MTLRLRYNPASTGGVLVILASTTLMPLSTSAQSFSLNGTTTAGLQLGSGSSGLSGSIAAEARRATPTFTLQGNGSLGLSVADNDTDVSFFGQLRATQRLKRGRLNAGATYQISPFSFDQFAEDLSFIGAEEGERTRFTLFAGVGRDLDARTQISANVSYARTDFDPVSVEFVPSDSYDAGLRLNRTLDNTTTGFAELGIGWFTSENEIKTESLSASGQIGARRQVDANQAVDVGLGLSFINTEEEVGSLRVAEWSTAFLFNAGLQQDYADGTLSLRLNQEVSPAASGELAVNTTVNAGLTYVVNRMSSLALDGSIGRQSILNSNEDPTTVFQVSPSYGLEITDGVSATARYTLRSVDDNTTHRFNFGFARTFGGN